MSKTIAQLYLEKHEQLSEKEKEVLLKSVAMENIPIFTTNDVCYHKLYPVSLSRDSLTDKPHV